MTEPQGEKSSVSEREFLLREQTCLLLENTKTAFAVNITISFLTYLAIRTPECVWLFLIPLVSGFRLLFYAYFQKRLKPHSKYIVIYYYLLALVALQGLSWGVASIMIYVEAGDIKKFYLIAIVCGMSGGSILTLAPSFTAFIIFTLTAVSPLVVALLVEAKSGFLPAGLMGIVFLFAVIYLGKRINYYNIDLLLTNRVLDSTARELALHKNQLEKIVAERTEELRNSKESYRRLTEEINEAIYELDSKGVIGYISPVIEVILGYTPEQLLGMKFTEILRQDDIPLFQKALADVVQNNNESLDCRANTRSGEFRWVRISFRPIMDNGELQGVRGLIGDIENEKNAEIEKEKLLQRFYEHQKLESLATFAGGVAHEFNNLLMGIQGHASLLAGKLSGSNEKLQHLKVIEDQVLKAKNLTTQLLGTASRGKYDPKPLDINRLISKCAFLLERNTPGIHVEENIHGSVLMVEADKHQLEQAFLNIFWNASEAMSGSSVPSKITLESSLVNLEASDCEPYELEPGPYAKICVTDNGRGMDESTLRRVFDPFFTTKQDARGAGLGLAATYGIIKNHGGVITAVSTIGEGSTFNVFLPLTEKELLSAEKPAAAEIPGGSETVLLVDDEAIIQQIGQALLEKLGYNVLVAENGMRAVRYVQEYGSGIKLVILDMVMPVMDGNMTFDEIRRLQPSIPVLLATGYSLDSFAKNLMAKGCNGFLQKPFSLRELSQKVREILDNAS